MDARVVGRAEAAVLARRRRARGAVREVLLGHHDEVGGARRAPLERRVEQASGVRELDSHRVRRVRVERERAGGAVQLGSVEPEPRGLRLRPCEAHLVLAAGVQRAQQRVRSQRPVDAAEADC